MPDQWIWKNKDGSAPGLLYESGNWGDLIKLLWTKAVIDWKQATSGPANYLDPFAGDADYPLTRKSAHRIRCTGRERFGFIEKKFLANARWPSAASGLRGVVRGEVEVWDLDEDRRRRWSEQKGFTVADADSGWTLIRDHKDDAKGVWLIDPYDILSEWRERLPLIAERSRRNTILLYIYNRSGKNPETFKQYRVFKNALDDALGERPKRLGRVASDHFLPQAYHEMLFLPSDADIAQPSFPDLLDRLGDEASAVSAGVRTNASCEA